jgi:hypothetical protein
MQAASGQPPKLGFRRKSRIQSCCFLIYTTRFYIYICLQYKYNAKDALESSSVDPDSAMLRTPLSFDPAAMS